MLVALGQVFEHRGEAALVRAAQVTGYALAAMKNLHRARCDSRFQGLTHQGVWNAVAVPFKLHMLVNVNPHGLVHR